MEKKLIYLASNEKSIAHLLEYVLFSKGGYVIKPFSSNAEIVNQIIKNPDIIILNDDFKHCLTSLIEIKKHKSNIPVIILSSEYDYPAEEKYYQNGALKYIIQDGYFIDNLIETIEMAFDKHTVTI